MLCNNGLGYIFFEVRHQPVDQKLRLAAHKIQLTKVIFPFTSDVKARDSNIYSVLRMITRDKIIKSVAMTLRHVSARIMQSVFEEGNGWHLINIKVKCERTTEIIASMETLN